MKAPDKIYLQVCGTCPLEGVECERCNFDGLEEVTWSIDKVFDKDVAYIRNDALLEWAKEKVALYERKMQEFEQGSEYEVDAYRQIVEKLNSL